MSRTFSNVSANPMDASMTIAEQDDSAPEIDTIPPLPLHALFAADRDESGAQQTEEGRFSALS